jgi:hypothetical protein
MGAIFIASGRVPKTTNTLLLIKVISVLVISKKILEISYSLTSQRSLEQSSHGALKAHAFGFRQITSAISAPQRITE